MSKKKSNYQKLRGDEVKSLKNLMTAIEKWYSRKVYNLAIPRSSQNIVDDAVFIERIRAYTLEHEVSFMIVEYKIGEKDIKIILQSR